VEGNTGVGSGRPPGRSKINTGRRQRRLKIRPIVPEEDTQKYPVSEPLSEFIARGSSPRGYASYTMAKSVDARMLLRAAVRGTFFQGEGRNTWQRSSRTIATRSLECGIKSRAFADLCGPGRSRGSSRLRSLLLIDRRHSTLAVASSPRSFVVVLHLFAGHNGRLRRPRGDPRRDRYARVYTSEGRSESERQRSM